MGVNEFPKQVLDALERDGGIRIKGSAQRKRDADGRLCYGAGCTWFGSIHETSSTKTHTGDIGHALPCCPLCGSVLFELPDEGEWWDGIDTFEKGTYPAATAHQHPGYRAMWEWQRGNRLCFSDVAALKEAFKAMQNVDVDIQP